LLDISSNYNGGLPTSGSSNMPSISATVNLAVTSSYLLDSQVRRQLQIDQLIALYSKRSIFENAMAPGWAAIAKLSLLYNQDFGMILESDIEDLDDAAKRTLENPDVVPEELIEHKQMVEEMLKKRQYK
jgi:hypothetical protein